MTEECAVGIGSVVNAGDDGWAVIALWQSLLSAAVASLHAYSHSPSVALPLCVIALVMHADEEVGAGRPPSGHAPGHLRPPRKPALDPGSAVPQAVRNLTVDLQRPLKKNPRLRTTYPSPFAITEKSLPCLRRGCTGRVRCVQCQKENIPTHDSSIHHDINRKVFSILTK